MAKVIRMHQANRKVFHINASILFIFVNIIIFLVQTFIPGATSLFVLDASKLWSQPWRLLTSMFAHGGFAHLFFNMYALLMFGSLIEGRIGTRRFVIFYLIAGLFAGLVGSLVYKASLGASGAIMGIIGLTIMLLPDLKVLFFFVVPMSMRTAGIVFAALDLFGLFTESLGNIAHLAHLAGLALGLAYGYYLIRRKKSFHANVLHGHAHAVSARRKSGKDDMSLSDEEIDEYLRYGRV